MKKNIKKELPVQLLNFDKPFGNVLIIYTGGTFGMVINKSKNILEPYDLTNLIDYFPDLNQLNINVSLIHSSTIMDSSNVTMDMWIELVEIIEQNYHKYDGFIVIHGTDTMAYSASALSFLIENLDKPVIFTGAQLPVSMLRSDARDNLISALEIATLKKSGEPVLKEVAIYFNNILLRGNRSKKVESSHFDAFESPNYPILAETGINIDFQEENLLNIKKKYVIFHKKLEDKVAVVKLFPSISKEYLMDVFGNPNLKGIVLESFGSGNAPTYDWFLDILRTSIGNGMLVFNVSQCIKGTVSPNRYETGNKLYQLGVVPGKNITTEAAVTKLMFVLANHGDLSEKKEMLTCDIRGEMND